MKPNEIILTTRQLFWFAVNMLASGVALAVIAEWIYNMVTANAQ